MWNEILSESQSVKKFDNASVLVLGSRHTGKRTLIDGLCEISKTIISKKNQEVRIRDKSLVSAIDYAYVNATNLNDPDNKMSSKLQFFLVDDDSFKSMTELLIHNQNILSKLIIIIALDSAQPWTFMIELDKWINFINQLLAKAGLPISKLDEMKEKVEKYFVNYKEPEFDQDGKLVKKLIAETQQSDQKLVIPLPSDILLNNIRIPLVVVATKADLQSTVLREKTSEKMAFIQYHLRKFCLNYGGTLIYVSNRNHSNLDVLYQYLLHRAYGFPLRFKAQTVNEESVFVPLGSDNFQLLNDSIKVSPFSYNEMIPIPVVKKQVKEEVQVEDDNQFFEKFAKEANVSNKRPEDRESSSTVTSQTSSTAPVEVPAATTAPPARPENNVTDFYRRLLEGGTNKNRPNLNNSTRTGAGTTATTGAADLTRSTVSRTTTEKEETKKQEIKREEVKKEEPKLIETKKQES